MCYTCFKVLNGMYDSVMGPCHLPFTLSMQLHVQGGGMLTGYQKNPTVESTPYI